MKNEEVKVNVGDVVLVDARGVKDSLGKSLLKVNHPVCITRIDGEEVRGLLMGSSPKQFNNPQRPYNVPIYDSSEGFMVKPTSYVEADHVVIFDKKWVHRKLGKLGSLDFSNVIQVHYKLNNSEIRVMETLC